MAPKRRYTDADKAAIFTALTAHDGNVKRVSREIGIPEQTVRDAKHKWAREGVPASVEVAIPAALKLATDEYVKVRDKALEIALFRLNDPDTKVSARDATWIAGVMTDKIRLLSGEATSRTEHLNQGPSAAEIGQALVDALQQAVVSQELREVEVIDGELVDEQALMALAPATP